MVINELSPAYVPVELCISKEEKDSINTVIGMIDILLTKDIELRDAWDEEITYKLDDIIDMLVGLRDGFPNVELRYYK